MKKIDLGIYDNMKTGSSLKIVNTSSVDELGQKIITMYFTNDPIFGKGQFGILAKNIKNFLKGYKKRKN